MGDFDQAVRRRREETLVCPHCQTPNTPGATLIELEPDGRARCAVCTRHFLPKEP